MEKTYFELSISCKSLKDKDYFSKSDPLCQVSLQRLDNEEEWVDMGRTEMIKDDLNPTFSTKILIGEGIWNESKERLIRFTLWDIDYIDKPLEKNDFLGMADVSLAEFQGDSSGTTKGLLNQDAASPAMGTITVTCEKIIEHNKKIRIQIGANLLKEGESKKNNSFFRLFKRNLSPVGGDDHWVLVYKSETIQLNENDDPLWESVELSLASLCNGDKDREIMFDFEPTKSYCRTSVNGLFEAREKHRGNIKLNAHNDKSIPWAFLAVINIYVDK